ncbi:hypothetical protein V6Z12_A09G027300 [Gossypium hirsutum]
MDSSICLPKWSRVHNKIFDNGGIRSIFLASPFKKIVKPLRLFVKTYQRSYSIVK